ncbi:MAG: hypothetical protein M1838_000229 [Thelocarpon superellum]|nr:MAG: hypothetical protein M1838_000229 [Thelocarpon superellum]
MSSDADYASFLDQVDQDPAGNKATASATSSRRATTKAVNTAVPASLQEYDGVYASDADEPFEPVSLEWNKESWPSEDEFKHLIAYQGTVIRVSVAEWDGRGQYKDAIDAITNAAKGTGRPQVFRVEHDQTRLEYYVVALDKPNARLVGLRAKAVES